MLDVRSLFQPSPVTDQLRRHARSGDRVSVSIAAESLDVPQLTGVTQTLFIAFVETRIRNALYAAGYRHVTRRATPARVVFDANA